MKKRFVLYHLPAIFFAMLIFALSSLSTTPAILSEIIGADKLLHTLEYFIFGYLIMRVFATSPGHSVRSRAALLASMVGTAYGASDEFHQSLVPGRTASLYDVLFDALGVLLAAALYRPMRFRVGPLKILEDHLEREAES
jgi:VanZ family protein